MLRLSEPYHDFERFSFGNKKEERKKRSELLDVVRECKIGFEVFDIEKDHKFYYLENGIQYFCQFLLNALDYNECLILFPDFRQEFDGKQ